MLQNLHTHTIFCDGIDTAEEMVSAAIAKGFDSLGFSGHAPMCFPSDYDMSGSLGEYTREIKRLKKKYKGEIDIFLGCELDRYSEGLVLAEEFDYTIASVHHGFCKGVELPFDHKAELSQKAIDELFGGDKNAYVSLYFDTLCELPGAVGGDILGHFDVVSKFSEKHPTLIDTESEFYKKKALETLHALRPFYEFYEINTGAMARGHRTSPYPAEFFLREMKELNCKLIITSDCHNSAFLDHGFDKARQLLSSVGFEESYYLGQNGFFGEKI